MFERLKGDNYVKRPLYRNECLAILTYESYSRIGKPLVCGGYRFLRYVNGDHLRGAAVQKHARAVAYPAARIEHTSACDELTSKPVSIEMAPNVLFPLRLVRFYAFNVFQDSPLVVAPTSR